LFEGGGPFNVTKNCGLNFPNLLWQIKQDFLELSEKRGTILQGSPKVLSLKGFLWPKILREVDRKICKTFVTNVRKEVFPNQIVNCM